MRINVTQILAEDLGSTRTYTISGEQPSLEDLELVSPLEGSVQITKSEDGLLVRGRVETTVMLDCHRCLQRYEHPLQGNFSANYTARSVDYPVLDGTDIDIAPLVREELILSLPSKQLCSADCAGLAEAELFAAEPVQHHPILVTTESTTHHGSTKKAHHSEH